MEKASLPVRVVYILGSGRSGSTLLDIVLGNHPAIESVGELKELVRLRWPQNGFCSCGLRTRSCDFWPEVYTRWIAEIGDHDLSSYVDTVRFFLQLRNWRAWKKAIEEATPEVRRFQAQSLALYRSIREVSGKEIIVDSSKGPGLALLLASIPEIELSILHLVRDGRGVAWSFLKGLEKDEAAGLERRLVPTPAWKVALRWMAVNHLAEWVRRRVDDTRSVRVRYEDLTSDPHATLVTIGRVLGEDLGSFGQRISAGCELSTGHKIGGSRIRMQKSIRLAPPDDAWKDSLSASGKLVFQIVAAGRLRQYGYL